LPRQRQRQPKINQRNNVIRREFFHFLALSQSELCPPETSSQNDRLSSEKREGWDENSSRSKNRVDHLADLGLKPRRHRDAARHAATQNSPRRTRRARRKRGSDSSFQYFVSFVTFVVKNFATNAYFFGFALQRRRMS
jgi:hypothetical protein